MLVVPENTASAELTHFLKYSLFERYLTNTNIEVVVKAYY